MKEPGREAAIKVEGLGKRYRIGAIKEPYKTLREAIVRGVTWPVRRWREGRNANETLWALKDVSFEIQRGEVVGVVGRNGAGKSTLLKLLSRITDPTCGYAEIHGRVGSLLEVGTGFHPELTGRENIFLNGSILGMRKKEIEKKFDEIVAFSEIEKFIDTPVKRYSSGMYMRLAFAVAANLEPEILLVDEVLAVGDAAFQKKCLGKMGEVARQGRTVLFVSHNMAAVNNLCTRCLWIDQGTLRQEGPTGQIVHAYLERSEGNTSSGEVDLCRWPNRYGSGEARIISAKLLDETGKVATVVRRTRPMAIEFIVQSSSSHTLHFSLAITAESGTRVLHLAHHDTPDLRPGVLEGKYCVRFEIPVFPLCEGNYHFALAIHTENLTPVDVVSDVLSFVAEDIVDSPRPYKTVAEYAYCWAPNTCTITPLA